MRRTRWFMVLVLLVPGTSSALQLRWSSGSTDLNFTAATRCTMVVQADSTATRLPSEWRLLWVADSASVQFVKLDSLDACALDEAQVSQIEGPATPPGSAANLITAQFCSAGNDPTTIARQVVDLPAGGHGKFKIIALDPTDPDSARVIASNEVTYNGGIEVSYAPVVLRASSVHQSLQLRVTAVGAGLNTANSMSVVALDSSWTLPLAITAQNDALVTGTASVAAVLPACQASVGGVSGAISTASLPADEEPVFLDPLGGCQAQYHEAHPLTPPPGLGFAIQPKDFAFVRGFVDDFSNRFALHLFYIRKNMWYTSAQNDLNEKRLGHSWTTNFNSWTLADTTFFEVRPGKFDQLHVWAPTIVQRGPMFWMFYTGVRIEDGKRHQRIGVATSTDLNTWTRADEPVLTAPEVPWAKKDPQGSPYAGAQQLRDPFVMEDPINPGQWLMYFVAVDSLTAPRMAVGVARSPDLLNWTALTAPLRSTQKLTFQGTTNVVESPHVFRRNGQWWLPYTVNGDQVFFETTTGANPADTTVASWTNPVWLRGVAEGRPPTLQYWHATEYLRINSTEYLAAFDDNAISIDIKGIFAPSSPESAAVDSFLLTCPEIAGIADRGDRNDGVRLAIARLRWGASEVRLRLELPSRMPVKLAVYDIAGRRRSTLLDGEVAAGVTEVAWNGRDPEGGWAASGMYFVRLTYANGARVSKLVMLR